jgi:hypothetical protein
MTVKLRLREENGTHGIVAVFVGYDMDHLVRAGEIVVRMEEWHTLVLDSANILVVEDKDSAGELRP